MKFYLCAGLVNGGILMGALLWLYLDGFHILPTIALALSSLSTGIFLGEAND